MAQQRAPRPGATASKGAQAKARGRALRGTAWRAQWLGMAPGARSGPARRGCRGEAPSAVQPSARFTSSAAGRRHGRVPGAARWTQASNLTRSQTSAATGGGCRGRTSSAAGAATSGGCRGRPSQRGGGGAVAITAQLSGGERSWGVSGRLPEPPGRAWPTSATARAAPGAGGCQNRPGARGRRQPRRALQQRGGRLPEPPRRGRGQPRPTRARHLEAGGCQNRPGAGVAEVSHGAPSDLAGGCQQPPGRAPGRCGWAAPTAWTCARRARRAHWPAAATWQLAQPRECLLSLKGLRPRVKERRRVLGKCEFL